jgi:hypothetical protein
MPHALSDIKSLHVTYYMADMICHKVYELLMSILRNIYRICKFRSLYFPYFTTFRNHANFAILLILLISILLFFKKLCSLREYTFLLDQKLV